jgi:hypothetical protein
MNRQTDMLTRVDDNALELLQTLTQIEQSEEEFTS